MIKIIKPGLLTTVQDLGRYGFQKYGIIASGAMDQLSHRIANLLVGNDESKPALEITLIGPVIEFTETALISLAGGNLSPKINGCAIDLWRPTLVSKGSTLSFGPCKTGCRAYLAIAGSFQITTVMGSDSTYLRAGIGGFKGRALKAGDVLRSEPMSKCSTRIFQRLSKRLAERDYIEATWMADPILSSCYMGKPPIRVIKGRQYHWFTEESKQDFFQKEFMVTSQSDRMGYRLKGEPLALATAEEMVSEAVGNGSIQVPAEGNPIVLLADRQTTGGYPKIAQIATVDLPIIAQAKPGDKLQFKLISLKESQLMYLEREERIRQLKIGISLLHG
ncbi:biotin-dependent carboxyltransferase family protein [Peribacillus loiseleuriae]|uniref:KipI antagonist n=1 Tax=Peribacillus loiseleuriae TaxID=1679170 RepID=A0A0K9H0L5_9BACI|nr:biotin-dependent carboxyltransferase family protein [Peribacillus loiseleuriae]KMY52052.1 KipI antagonist [Peribacillus loiseleuriae]